MNILKEIQPGELAVIAARPGMGKTSLMISLAHELSPEKKVLIFSLEESKTNFLKRAMSNLLRTRTSDIDSSVAEEYYALKPHIHVIDEPVLTVPQVIEQILHYSKEEKADLVFIDYLQLINWSEHKTDFKKLKEFALKENVKIILISQVIRTAEFNEDKRPQLKDISEFLPGNIEKIFFLWCADYYAIPGFSEGYAEIYAAREEQGYKEELRYDKEYGRFY
jgi:replicative DNA helicase